jgi:ferredoxin
VNQVLICADHHTPDLERPDLTSVPGLCSNPHALSAISDDAERLVLGLHLDEADPVRFQSSMRRLGFDPLGVGIVDLSASYGPGALQATIGGAVARAERFPGAGASQAKLRPSRRMSRRGLLSGLALESIGAPAIDTRICVSDKGCRACVESCPVEALSWTAGSISLDKTTCVSCGICITTCPIHAVINPTATGSAIEAEIAALIAAFGSPPGIRYRCRDAVTLTYDEGWLTVEVPCTGMLTPGWLLAPLAMGAAAVDALGCDVSRCRLANHDRLAVTINDSRRLLRALALDPDRISASKVFELLPLCPPAGPFGILGPGTDRLVTAALASLTETRSASAPLEKAAMGTITIDPITCTACRMCAETCPTGALTASNDKDVVIEFDPGLCAACRQCLTICPEVKRGAIALSVGFDLSDWQRGRRELRRDSMPRCDHCGKPIAPSAMLSRITSMLGEEHASTTALLTTRCLECRGR